MSLKQVENSEKFVFYKCLNKFMKVLQILCGIYKVDLIYLK